ncbi:MAG: META domain-containing protein [Limnobacter sp.]|nr:META domain-containing protein [Limnobacter sp.]
MQRAVAASLALLFVAGLLGACARLPFRTADPAPAQPAQARGPTRTPATTQESTSTPASTPASPTDAIVGHTWQWTGLLSPTEEMDVYAWDRYTVRFLPTGRIELTADCRSGRGDWSATGEHGIEIGPVELGQASCPSGSLSERFATELRRSSAWLLGEGGELYLELPEDSGVLRFRRQR